MFFFFSFLTLALSLLKNYILWNNFNVWNEGVKVIEIQIGIPVGQMSSFPLIYVGGFPFLLPYFAPVEVS